VFVLLEQCLCIAIFFCVVKDERITDNFSILCSCFFSSSLCNNKYDRRKVLLSFYHILLKDQLKNNANYMYIYIKIKRDFQENLNKNDSLNTKIIFSKHE
jgi:hypothetical protein